MDMTNMVHEMAGNSFPSHGVCWNWTWPLINLHVFSDIIIAFSYFSIPATLLLLISKKPSIPFKWLFFMFAMFIIACGSTHVMGVITIWKPWFWAEGYVKLWCAFVSIITAISIFPLLPAIVGLKSRSEYQDDISKLELIIKNRDEIIDKLMKINVSVEDFSKKNEKK